MAQEDPNRLSEWLLLARRQIPVLRQRLDDWLRAVREEPSLIWQTPAVRYGAYGLTGLILLGVAVRFTRALAPPTPEGVRAAATSADFHVVCADAECSKHFVIHRPFGFDDFPVRCPSCGKNSGIMARPCNSSTCKGRWVAPIKVDRVLKCPLCGGRFE